MASEDYEPSHGYMNDFSLTLHLHHQALIAISIIFICIIFVVAFCFFNIARHMVLSSGAVSLAAAETAANRNKGLDEASINSLPMFLHKHSSMPYSEEDGFREISECAICLSEVEENEMIKVIPTCMHAYHSECVDKWLRNQAACPLCRATIHSFHDQQFPA